MAATNLAEISEHIKKMKFKRRFFGGVDEEDVWKKIRELDQDYRNLFKIQTQLYKMQIKKLKTEYSKKTRKDAKKTTTKN